MGRPQNISTTQLARAASRAGQTAGGFPRGALGRVDGHDAAANFSGDDHIIGGQFVGQPFFLIRGVGGQILHITNLASAELLGKRAFTAVKRLPVTKAFTAPQPLAGGQRRQHPDLAFLQKPPGQVTRHTARTGFLAACSTAQTRHRPPAPTPSRPATRAAPSMAHRAPSARGARWFIRRRGKSMGQAGVFAMRNAATASPESARSPPVLMSTTHPHTGKLHADTQSKIGYKVTAQPDNSERTPVGSFKISSFLAVSP